MRRSYLRRGRGVAVALLVALVAGGALIRGGAFPGWVALAAVFGAIALAAAPRPGSEHVAVSTLALGLAAAAGITAAQLIPIPPLLLRTLSPAAATTLDGALRPLGLYPAWRPLSLDPGATALELAKACALLCVIAAASVLGGSERRRTQLLAGIALSGAVTSFAVLGAALLGLSRLLEARVTFVNPNHLAGFLQLAAWPALGFALRSRGLRRGWWLIAFAITASGIFLSLSRGGIAAFFVATGIFAVLRLRAEPDRALTPAHGAPSVQPRHTGERGRIVTAIGFASALAVASYLALGPIVDELRTVTDTSTVEAKLALWPAALRIMWDFPAFGIGRGAFATVYPGYKLDPLQNTFTHVENEWLQLPVDLGVVTGTAVIVLFAWAFIAAARRRDLPRPLAGALAGAGAVVAHNLFDFSLEIPGVAIPFGIVLGIASCDMPRWLFRRGVVRSVAAFACGIALAGTAVHMRHATEDDGQRVSDASTSSDAIARAREALAWHPADYVPLTAVGVRLALERQCAKAAPWLTRAMTRNPTAPEPHRAMAGCLARAGRADLAKTEYRLAFLYGDADALREAYALYPQPGALLALAPDTPDGLLTVGLILKDRPAEAGEAWRRAWESFGSVDALGNLIVTRLALEKYEEALDLARRFEKAAPHDERSYVLAAVALEKLKRPEEGLAEFELAATRCPGERLVLVPLGQRHLEHGRYSQARTVFESIVARDGRAVGEKHRLIATSLEAQGRFKEALTEAQAARDAAPEDVETLELFSRLSAAVGRFDDAIEALEVASRLPLARSEGYGPRIAQLRAARDEQRIRQPARGVYE